MNTDVLEKYIGMDLDKMKMAKIIKDNFSEERYLSKIFLEIKNQLVNNNPELEIFTPSENFPTKQGIPFRINFSSCKGAYFCLGFEFCQSYISNPVLKLCLIIDDINKRSSTMSDTLKEYRINFDESNQKILEIKGNNDWWIDTDKDIQIDSAKSWEKVFSNSFIDNFVSEIKDIIPLYKETLIKLNKIVCSN